MEETIKKKINKRVKKGRDSKGQKRAEGWGTGTARTKEERGRKPVCQTQTQ